MVANESGHQPVCTDFVVAQQHTHAPRMGVGGHAERRFERGLAGALHHQLRPWAMKKNVEVVHRPDNRLDWTLIKVN